MMIQGEFFQIIPVNEHSLQFDLKLLQKIKGKNPREEYKDAGYGMPLDTAIKKCIQYGLSQKLDVISLKEYLAEYKHMAEEIGLQLNENRKSVPVNNG